MDFNGFDGGLCDSLIKAASAVLSGFLTVALTADLAVLLAALPAVRAAEADADQTNALHALFDRAWEWSAVEFPEFATYRGDLRYNDRLSDASLEAQTRRDAQTAAFLAEARAISRDKLAAIEIEFGSKWNRAR